MRSVKLLRVRKVTIVDKIKNTLNSPVYLTKNSQDCIKFVKEMKTALRITLIPLRIEPVHADRVKTDRSVFDSIQAMLV